MTRSLQRIFTRFGLEIRRQRRSIADTETVYLQGGTLPWSAGYEQFKEHFIRDALQDQRIMEAFTTGTSLPAGYGVGIDERCIEYPWLFSRLPKGKGRLLDAGSALNHLYLLHDPLLREKKLHILTLFPENDCHWTAGISYLFEDLRYSPVSSGLYDWIVCISTLEHIGCDNSIYTGDQSYNENNSDGFRMAMAEMHRMLRPGGQLFITVPFGSYQHLGFSLQFDLSLLKQAIMSFGGSIVSQAFYRYTRDGWQSSTAADCASCRYVDWIASVWRTGIWPDKIPQEPDLAAAARAVACLHLAKS